MKLSCLPVSLYGAFQTRSMSLAEWFQWAGRHGLDGADISVAHLDSLAPAYLHRVRDSAAAHGVQIAMLVTYSDFTLPEADQRAAQMCLVQRQIDAAAHLEAAFVRLTAGQARPGISSREGLQWAGDGLRQAAAYAARQGVQAVYENHTRGSVWQWNDFSQAAHRFLALAAALADSELGLLFDTANNLALFDDPVQVLAQITERVSAVHLADIREPGSFRPVLMGQGASPHLELLSMLATAGFNGWISVEEASGNGLQGLAHGCRHADAIWRAAGGTPRARASAVTG